MDKKEKNPNPYAQPMDTPVTSAELQEVFRRIQPEMRREKPSADAIAAAMEAVQRLAAEADAEDATVDVAHDLATDSKIVACRICGYQNRVGNKFCGMCGISVAEAEKAASGASAPRIAEPAGMIDLPPTMFPEPERLATTRPAGNETHHYHHQTNCYSERQPLQQSSEVILPRTVY